MNRPYGRDADTVRWMPPRNPGRTVANRMLRFLLPLIAAFLPILLPTSAQADPTPPGAIVVNTTADTDERCDQGATLCTLRGAILTANAKPGADVIAFNLPLVTRIAPETPLPPITERVTIDGYTQAGLPEATRPQIELDGSQMALGSPTPAAKAVTAQPLEDAKAMSAQASADGVVRFLRPWGLELLNADGSTIRGLMVHDFPYAQIGLDGTDQATITGNWLGLDPLGDAQTRTSAADSQLGLSLINSAQATIGGPGREKNVISGNDIGIALHDAGASANRILGNYVGATTNGLGRRPNRETGILLTEPVGTTGRGTRQNQILANVILGDADKSYGISVLAATETLIYGNFVGLNAAGEAKSGTGEPLGHDLGVFVHDSPKTEIGGTGTAENNLIAGNRIGLEVNGGSNASTIAGNFFGTDHQGKEIGDGTANRTGIAIVADGESEAPADLTVTANVIAGATSFGMYITGGAQRPTVTDNRFGTDVDGVKALRNRIGFAAGPSPTGAGSPANLTFGPGNVVAGNSQDGVQMLGGANAVVRGNRIGVSADSKPLGNGTSGVLVEGDGTRVEDNTISANAQGVVVNGAADNVHVRANRIGTAPDGGTSGLDFGNGGAGVLVTGTAPDHPLATRVGGSGHDDGNVISGNGRGVQVHGDADETTIRQNHIGVDTTGAHAIPNGIGVSLTGGTRTVVGGALGVDSRNLIAHNEDAGIRINGSEQSVIIGNHISGNDGPGVLADTRGGDAVIGWDVAWGGALDDVECRETRCNRIENNDGAGVRVEAGAEVTVRGNRMRGNAGLDVDLAGPGATANDYADADDWLNAPTGVAPIKATSATPDRIGGLLETPEPDKTLVDIYGFTSTDLLAGRPRGGEHIGHARPDARGEWRVDLPKPYAAYGAVVTDRHGTTSELSPACTGDTDGDALCDNWETTGIDYDADGRADQTLPGADPAKPDIYVEVDWQQGRKPHMKALYDVKEAFQLAPRPINLHTHVSEQVPGEDPIRATGRGLFRHDDVNDFLQGSTDAPCDGYVGSAEDREAEDCATRLAARRLAYRYALFGQRNEGGAEGIADPGYDAFIVTLGATAREDVLLGGGTGDYGCNKQYDACMAELEASTFMHELGHTLGLWHGGLEAKENEEPNYLSIMNYLFVSRALLPRPLDYSRKTPIARDERAFDEALPFFEEYPQRAQEPWTETAITTYDAEDDVCRYQRVYIDQPLQIDDDPAPGIVTMGLNDSDHEPDPQGLENCQKPENHTSLTGSDDWSRLRYSRHGRAGWSEGHYGSEQPGEGHAYLRPSELAAQIDGDGDGVDDDEDVCPAVSDPGQADADEDGLGDACLPFITERDVEVTLEGASANVPVGGERTLEVTVRNTYPKPAAGAVIQITPPAGVQVDQTRWEAGEIPARGSKKLTLTVRGVAPGRGELTAELVELADTDWDAAPGNHDAAEDDQAAKRLTVFQPGEVATVALSGAATREGDEADAAGVVRVDVEGQTGMAISGRLRSVGGTATPGEDYEPVDATVENPPFSGEQFVQFKVFGDQLDEPHETIEFELSGIDGAQPETVRGVLTITDDDDPLQPGQVAWMGCASRDYGAGRTCPQREPLVTSPTGTKALTPDGRFLWVPDRDRIVRLERDPATGELGDARCWTTTGPALGDCDSLGLDMSPSDVLVAPDGKRLYVYGGAEGLTEEPSAALVSLALDAAGEPSFDSCVAGGAPGCTELVDPAEPILAPDGKHLLTIEGGRRFDHGEITVYPIVDGHLKPAARCYAHPGEGKPCLPLTVDLDGIPYMEFAPDGRTLAVRTKDNLALLGWDAGAGTLTVDGPCLRDGGRCRPATECVLDVNDEFDCGTPPEYLNGIGPVRFAPDGRALYVAAHKGNRVTALPRGGDRTWSYDGSMCVGREDTDCAVKAELVEEALELVVAPDSGDLYVSANGNGVTALQADRATGALSAPRCAYGELGLPSCQFVRSSAGAFSLSRGNMLFDPSGRDLYTVAWLPDNRSGIGRFLRVTRPPGGENRPPLCADADAAARPGETVELTLRCADPDGDPVTLRLTRGGGQLAGTRLRYTAGATAGLETVGFRASDGRLESAEAEARIVVGSPPACQDGHVTVEARGSVALPFSCDRGTIEVVEHPAWGGVVGATFTATARDGTEHVRYVAYDPDTGVRSNVATITVTVKAPPPPPEHVDFGSVSLENDRGSSGSGCSGSSCRAGRNGELPFRMRCNGSSTQTPGTCSGRLEACTATGGCRGSTGGAMIARLKGTLGVAKFSIPVGQSKTVKLKLNRAARKELAKRGKLKLQIRTTVRLPDGRTQTSTRKLTVSKPAAKKKGRR